MLYATFAKAPAIGARATCANLDHISTLRGVKHAFIVAHQGDPIGFNPAAAAVSVGRRDRRRLDLERVPGEEGARSAMGRDRKRRTTAGRARSREAKTLATKPAAQMLGEAGNVEAAFKAGKTVEAFYTYPLRVARGPRAAELHGLVQGRQHRDLGADADAAERRRRRGRAARSAEGEGHAASAARRRRLRPAARERQRRAKSRADLEAGRRHSGQGAVDARGRHGVRLLPARAASMR